MLRTIGITSLLLFVLLGTRELRAQGRITPVKITDNIYMFQGRGGNVGACFGDDGVFIIDSQFATETGAILGALKKLTEDEVRFLINTHWHGDHVGGNENFANRGSIIVAHRNVRERMSKKQFVDSQKDKERLAPKALPVVTFTTDMTLQLNGEEVQILHVDPAHTDGDSFVFLKTSNVLHMGDTFFKDKYPYVDVSSGGHLAGLLDAVELALKLTDGDTQIIPGHGDLAKRSDLIRYRDTLRVCHDSIAKLIAEGLSDDQIVESNPTANYDDSWGSGFMKPEPWVRIVCEGIRKHRKDGESQ